MLELANLSNESFDTKNLLGGKPQQLEQFLRECGLDGIEFLPCEPWNPALHPARYIKGVHLRFWPNWLDFWRGDKKALWAEFGSDAAIRRTYGKSREDWLLKWRENFRQAGSCGADYGVFHIAQARTSELYRRRFAYTSAEVVEASIELLNEIVDALPAHCRLLFENLWWPGLTLLEPWLAGRLLEKVRHPFCGFMLDSGHLMNTNTRLTSEAEAVDYELQVLDGMGELRQHILGMHLHCSLSGMFVEGMKHRQGRKAAAPLDWQQTMDYILRTDQHAPFRSTAVKRLVQAVYPRWLVHEFIQDSYGDWKNKVNIQRQALKETCAAGSH